MSRSARSDAGLPVPGFTNWSGGKSCPRIGSWTTPSLPTSSGRQKRQSTAAEGGTRPRGGQISPQPLPGRDYRAACTQNQGADAIRNISVTYKLAALEAVLPQRGTIRAVPRPEESPRRAA